MEKVLQGVRVLDFSRARAGPCCGQILADMGAEVIRVEMPGGDFDRVVGPYAPDGQSMYLMFTCRNKKGITLNLRKEKGKKLLVRLVQLSDIVIESFGPVANKELGLDYESLERMKQDIIVVAISAYGQYGPYATRAGFDATAQAMSGIMWVTGFPQDLPVRLGVSFVDTSSGIWGALGTMLAMHHRQKTGRGQLIDISLLDVAVSFMESIIAEYRVLNQIRPQAGNASVLAAPYDAYKATDGWVVVAAPTDSLWKAICRVTGRHDLANDPRFKTGHSRLQPENWQFLTEWLNQWVSERAAGEVVNQLNEAGVPCSHVNTVPKVVSDPQIQAREMIVELDHPGLGKVPLIGIPIKLSETPGEIGSPAPAIGEHNEEIYRELLGLSAREFSQLKREGVV